jgi:hypothetical protein
VARAGRTAISAATDVKKRPMILGFEVFMIDLSKPTDPEVPCPGRKAEGHHVGNLLGLASIPAGTRKSRK